MVIRLTPVSFIVLGLVRRFGAATPYQLKTAVGASVGNFWNVQHAQLYSEPQRLAGAGLLTEEREAGGRRRRTYRLTAAGEEAFAAWLASPPDGLGELREPGLLRLFLGADPPVLAAGQVELHERKLAEYEALRAAHGEQMPEGPRLALEAGIAHQRVWVEFWSALARDGCAPAAGPA
jgi:PadR family transcriptional regulator, regulatory protein AphA